MNILKRIRKWLNALLTDEGNDVWYIGGSDVFPTPLEPEKEAEILQKYAASAGKQAELYRNILIEHNLRLVVFLSKRYESTGIGTEDLVSIGTIGLIKAVTTFKSEKNIRLATYASRCIENEILMYIRKIAKTKNDVSLEEPLNVDRDGNELLLSDILGTDENDVEKRIEQQEEQSLIRKAVAQLPTREREIIEMRFGFGKARQKEMTQKEVADYLGISQSYISRLEKKILGKLKKEIIGFYR